MICTDVRHSFMLDGGDQNRSEEHIFQLPIEEVHSVVRFWHHGGKSFAYDTIWILDKTKCLLNKYYTVNIPTFIFSTTAFLSLAK